MMRAMIFGAALVAAGAASAQNGAPDALFLRVEATRDANATEALSRWQADFPAAIAQDLPGDWTGILLGPLPPEGARATFKSLREQDLIPKDAYIVAADGRSRVAATALPTDGPVITLTQTDETPAQGPQVDASLNPVVVSTPETPQTPEPDEAPVSATPDLEMPPNDAAEVAQSEMTEADAEAEAEAPEVVAPEVPGQWLRLRAIEDETEAREALAELREEMPGGSLFQLESGWYVLAIGPLLDGQADAWLPVLKRAGTVPTDAYVADGAKLGAPVDLGQDPELPTPPEVSTPMPPLKDVQRALHWAGLYDGAIDGLNGPKTRSAINAEIVGHHVSTDPGTAMQALFERRTAWRNSFGLSRLEDPKTGLAVTAPMERLEFLRYRAPMSIWGPKDGSGAALILIRDEGDAARVNEIAGLVTALGWVPRPEQSTARGLLEMTGDDGVHLGRAVLRRDGSDIRGWVLIWPSDDALNAQRIAGELDESIEALPEPGAEAEAEVEPDTTPAEG